MIKKYSIKGFLALMLLTAMVSCKKYLDVVPDNVATIDNAFTTRTQAQKFLFTCYSYMPKDGDLTDDPAIAGGDEMWEINTRGAYFNIAKGLQNVVSPYGDRWTKYYQALRDCNIFLENIGRVPDLDDTERLRWISEVKFLKAYYHFYLMRMYGPIPLIKDNLAIDADADVIRVSRDPVDSCFNYVVGLLDESFTGLPLSIADPVNEAGRITQPIVLALKAKVLVTAASPLFNGNTDQTNLRNKDGSQLFNITYSKVKWDSAVVACKKAIDLCHEVGMKLYKYNPDFQQFNLTPATVTQLSIRNAVTEKWNSEIIWANTQSKPDELQKLMATWWDPLYLDGTVTRGELSPPLKVAEQFYTKNGVPISEDKTWDYIGRYSLRTSGDADKLHIKNGYLTAQFHFDREPRFYADLGFDGSIYYGQGKYDDSKPEDLFYLEAKFKQRNGFGKFNFLTVTGYYVKKLVHFQNVIGTGSTYSITSYPWPLIRLTDLYLLYSEALNESEGPGNDAYKYIDLVRERAGLASVESSWQNFSSNPTKYTTKEGLRSIIRQERLIEMAFEGQRFWDLRRWKEAVNEMNKPIVGWDLAQETAAAYYRPTVVFTPTFGTKDYFWPIRESNITANRNIVQNLGW